MDNTENKEINIVDNAGKQEIDIVALVSDLNNKSIKNDQVYAKYGLSEYKAKKLLKDKGYIHNNKTGKKELAIKEEDNSKIKATYRINTELYQAIKLQAIFERVTATDIIERALGEYIPQSTKDIIKANKK